MGPTIILDKSALEGVTDEELLWLGEHFTLNLVPVLVIELLGDLEHEDYARDKAQSRVRSLAMKVLAAGGYPNEHFGVISRAELAGRRVPMTGVPLIGGRHNVIPLSDGDYGVVTEATPENRALARWAEGRFDDVDRTVAERWRQSIKRIDLQAFQNRFRGMRRRNVTLGRLAAESDLLLQGTAVAAAVAGWWAEELGLTPKEARAVGRLVASLRQSFRDLAPFSTHCARCLMVFYGGLVHRLVPARPTNRVDVEYFFYAPFTHVICSDDRLFELLGPAILPEGKSLIRMSDLREELKDLIRRASEEPALQDASLVDRARAIDPLETGLIASLWRRHFDKWVPPSERAAQAGTMPERPSDVPEIAAFMKGIHELKTGGGGGRLVDPATLKGKMKFSAIARVGPRRLEQRRYGSTVSQDPETRPEGPPSP